MQAVGTQIKSAIKSRKSAAVKSSLIDQEVIFPFFLWLIIGDTFEFKGHRQFPKSSEQENLREVQPP